MSDRNRAAFERFCDLFYTRRRVREAYASLVGEVYIQHNPMLGDGVEAAIGMLDEKFGHPEARLEIQRMLVDGDLAVVHVKARLAPGSPLVAVADFSRFERGRIVEHWDVVQAMPEDVVSEHPLF